MTITQHGSQEYVEFSISELPGQNSVFELTDLRGSSRQRFLTKDSFFNLKCTSLNRWVHIMGEENEDTQSFYESKHISQNVQLKLTEQPQDEDTFKIFRASFTEVIENNFLKSCFPVLRKMLLMFQHLREEHEKVKPQKLNLKTIVQDMEKYQIESKLQQLKQCILDLTRFCKHQLINTTLDHQKNYGIISQARQNVLNQQYFIDNLIDLLQNMIQKEELVLLEKIQRTEKMDLKEAGNKNIVWSESSKKCVRVIISYLKDKFNIVVDQDKCLQKSKTKNVQSLQFFKLLEQVTHRQKLFIRQYLQEKVNIVKLIYNLLICICKDNTQNQILVYSKISQFSFQVQHIKESVDCIISILCNNYNLLQNICDDIKELSKQTEYEALQAEHEQELPQLPALTGQSSGMGTGVVQTRDQLLKRQQTQQIAARDEEQSVLQKKIKNIQEILKLNNILVLFVKITERMSSNQKNITFLQFFRQICKFQDRGISINQEMIYKFINTRPQFRAELLFNLKVIQNNKVLKIEFNKNKVNHLEQLKIDLDKPIADSNILYFIEQVKFYSDLALSRNFIWKNELDKLFPVTYIVEKMFDGRLHKDIRSAFCKLALSEYIDHEPQNKLVFPKMCVVYEASSARQHLALDAGEKGGSGGIDAPDDAQQKQRSSHNINQLASKWSFEVLNIQNHIFELLITKTQQYIVEDIQKMDVLNKEIFLPKQKDNQKKLDLELLIANFSKQAEKIINYNLTFDMIKTLSTLIQFDILGMLNKNEMYSPIVSILLRVFEYHRLYPVISYSLCQIREDKFRHNLELARRNQIISGFKYAIVSLQKQIKFGVTTVFKATQFIGTKLGILQRHNKNVIEEEFKDVDKKSFSRSPLVSARARARTRTRTRTSYCTRPRTSYRSRTRTSYRPRPRTNARFRSARAAGRHRHAGAAEEGADGEPEPGPGPDRHRDQEADLRAVLVHVRLPAELPDAEFHCVVRHQGEPLPQHDPLPGRGLAHQAEERHQREHLPGAAGHISHGHRRAGQQVPRP